ncbi:MAG: tripartite tricarboxylate transporter substrate binding protein [Proteobacteria bacterium]|nr:tripartite tricarboxylate transporter substrate binding protein [Burkholderiales bacterium]
MLSPAVKHAGAGALLLALWFYPGLAQAQAYPSRPIRLISPNPPGGANDLIARIVVTRLAEVLQTPMVIDNRGGAGGTIGGEIAARAVPDGYTLLAGSISTHSFSPVIQPRLGYDPIRDFTPISLFAVAQNLLVVHPALPVTNVRDLIAFARAKPGTINYASGGSGSTSHFAVALFASVAGIASTTVHVPYKGGAPAVAATVGNETQFYLGPMAGSIAQVKAGKLRALAVGGAARSAILPDVPTVREAGLPGYEASGWFGLLGPAGLPRVIVQRLNKAVHDTVGATEVQRQLLEVGAEGSASTPENFARFIADQLSTTRRLVKQLDLRFD